MLKWEDYTAAARDLSPSALNLYMYLAKNQDNYELWFSSKDYCKTFDVVDKTFKNAKNELLRKGYLKEGENNHIYFDACGGYKETKENLKEELKNLSERLKIEDASRYSKLIEIMTEAKLKTIKDENVYKIEIKKIISFAKDLLKEISKSEIDGLL
jgi:CRISPR/Cas system-associated protein Csm6